MSAEPFCKYPKSLCDIGFAELSDELSGATCLIGQQGNAQHTCS